MTGYVHPQLHAEIVAALKEDIRALEAQLKQRDEYVLAAGKSIDDLNVQCRFWRQAAEHAVKGWNALEETVEAAKEALDAIENNASVARQLLGSVDEWAPPESVLAEIPMLHIVETETPVKG